MYSKNTRKPSPMRRDPSPPTRLVSFPCDACGNSCSESKCGPTNAKLVRATIHAMVPESYVLSEERGSLGSYAGVSNNSMMSSEVGSLEVMCMCCRSDRTTTSVYEGESVDVLPKQISYAKVKTKEKKAMAKTRGSCACSVQTEHVPEVVYEKKVRTKTNTVGSQTKETRMVEEQEDDYEEEERRVSTKKKYIEIAAVEVRRHGRRRRPYRVDHSRGRQRHFIEEKTSSIIFEREPANYVKMQVCNCSTASSSKSNSRASCDDRTCPYKNRSKKRGKKETKKSKKGKKKSRCVIQ